MWQGSPSLKISERGPGGESKTGDLCTLSCINRIFLLLNNNSTFRVVVNRFRTMRYNRIYVFIPTTYDFFSSYPHTWNPLSRTRERGLFQTFGSWLSLACSERGIGSREGDGVFWLKCNIDYEINYYRLGIAIYKQLFNTLYTIVALEVIWTRKVE